MAEVKDEFEWEDDEVIEGGKKAFFALMILAVLFGFVAGVLSLIFLMLVIGGGAP